MSKLLAFFSSLRLTVACLAIAMVLLTAGTAAQVHVGILAAQKTYFRSFFLYWTPPQSTFAIPFFPGGTLLGIVLTLNLIATFSTQNIRRKAPILLMHFGVLTLVLSEMSAAILSQESQMPIAVGEVKNFSESRDYVELVLIDESGEEFDKVVAIPENLLQTNKTLSLSSLPFSLHIRRWTPHAELSMSNGTQHNSAFAVSRGIGKNILVKEKPTVTQDNLINTPAAVIGIAEGGKEIGTWLVSNALAEEQEFQHSGKTYTIQLRNKRYYYPFSLRLLEFRREMYPGTTIPKSFASLVKLYDKQGEPERDLLISMNNPLRHEGKTFYQASYGEGDNLSIFQVVDNPTNTLPYIASTLVACGLLAHFGTRLRRSKEKK